MANPEHLTFLKQGVSTWNDIRQRLSFLPDLASADLSAMDLTGANFNNAILNSALLYNASLKGADLSGATMIAAYLMSADLHGANLTAAKLLNAKLNAANLTDANLYGAYLDGADFSSAIMFWTTFGGVDLSSAKGLETASHACPSCMDVATIYKSAGTIPESFRRGASVPDNTITFIRHQIASAKAVQFSSAFISYSSKDDDFAKRLHDDLQAHQVRVWFAPQDLKIGEKFRSSIDEAIRSHDKVIAVLSENSINSAGVRREVKTALEKEKDHDRTVLFPIRLDDTVMNSTAQWADDIRRDRHIGDFTKWKEHDDYQNAFERLLRDLKAESQPPKA